MSEKKYRWSHPIEWLQDAAKDWDYTKLFAEFMFIVESLDGDTIQDLYQKEMNMDGYFDPIEDEEEIDDGEFSAGELAGCGPDDD